MTLRLLRTALLLVALVLFCSYPLLTVHSATEVPAELIDFVRAHPGMTAQDLYKIAFQATRGPGHLAPDSEHVLKWMLHEYGEMDSSASYAEPLITPIGNGYAHVNLSPFRELGGDPMELAAAMVASCQTTPDAQTTAQLWNVLMRLNASGQLPPSVSRGLSSISRQIRANGYPAMHHSKAYKTLYCPHYRVVRIEMLKNPPF